jgi:hypothetical protein
MQQAKLPLTAMKRIVVILAVAFGCAFVNSAAQTREWCANNCVTLCKKIYGSDAGACIERYNCPQYAGRPCASAAYVNARHTIYCENHPGECVGRR